MQTDDHVSNVKADLLKSPGTFQVLVGVTGSVAALKLPILVSQLLQLPGSSCLMTQLILQRRVFHKMKNIMANPEHPFYHTVIQQRFLQILQQATTGDLSCPQLQQWVFKETEVDVRVVTTEHAKHFYNPEEVSVKIYSDKDEWELWTQRSDPVLHIELRRWADLLLIAPLDANTLGKLASGICDNLLTCVARAWDISRPLIFCPAMNTAMWLHPITEQHVSKLREFGYVEIPCISKKLVCGDEGKGAMAEVSTIVSVVKQFLQKPEESSQKT